MKFVALCCILALICLSLSADSNVIVRHQVNKNTLKLAIYESMKDVYTIPVNLNAQLGFTNNSLTSFTMGFLGCAQVMYRDGTTKNYYSYSRQFKDQMAVIDNPYTKDFGIQSCTPSDFVLNAQNELDLSSNSYNISMVPFNGLEFISQTTSQIDFGNGNLYFVKMIGYISCPEQGSKNISKVPELISVTKESNVITIVMRVRHPALCDALAQDLMILLIIAAVVLLVVLGILCCPCITVLIFLLLPFILTAIIIALLIALVMVMGAPK